MHQDEWIKGSLMLLCFGVATGLFCLGRLKFLSSRSSSLPQIPPLSQNFRRDETLKMLPMSSFVVQSTQNFKTHLVVDLSDRQVSLYHLDQLQETYPVAVGKEGWETPTGRYQVQQLIAHPSWRQPITGEDIPPGPDNPLGDRWIGFWSEGQLQFGFHGSNQESLIGEAVSHGCLRMRNQDIRTLFEQISEGTPIFIRP